MFLAPLMSLPTVRLFFSYHKLLKNMEIIHIVSRLGCEQYLRTHSIPGQTTVVGSNSGRYEVKGVIYQEVDEFLIRPEFRPVLILNRLHRNFYYNYELPLQRLKGRVQEVHILSERASNIPIHFRDHHVTKVVCV